MRIHKLNTLLFALLCTGGLCLGEPTHSVKVWTSEQGLPGNSVFSLIQSQDGYLWMGTLYGLARFDGARFEVFDESNTRGLTSSRIIKLVEDSRRRLWIGTANGGISVIEKGGAVTSLSLTSGSVDQDSRVMAMAEDKLGGVWLYSATGRLGLSDGTNMTAWALGQNLRPTSRTMALESSGILWVSDETNMIALHPQASFPAQSLILPIVLRVPARSVDFLLASKSGGHWRFADNRVARYSGTKLEVDLGLYPWPDNVIISAACEDLQGNLVVGTYGSPGAGVYWSQEPGKWHRIEGLSHNSVHSLLFDREGLLWVGTDGGGLDRVREQVFKVLPNSAGRTVQSVCPDGANGVWIGYNGDRIEHWTSESTKSYVAQSPLAVRSIFVDKAQTVWVGTLGAGLQRLQSGSFVRDDAYAEVGNPVILAIYQSRAGDLWVGSGGGLAHATSKGWRTLSSLDGLPAKPVQAITEDTAGNLWIGLDGGGLCRVRDGVVSVFTRTNGLPSDNVTALYSDSNGALWVGTAGGLTRLKEGRWGTFTRRSGLSGNSIGYIIEDAHGFLWIGSNGGIMRVRASSLDALAEGKTDPVTIRSYGQEDGVPTREVSQGSQPAASSTPDGRIWLATIKGLVYADPASIQINSNAPAVVIESVFIDSIPQQTNLLRTEPLRTIRVAARRESLDIHYTVLHFAAPEKAKVRYRMAGHETAWTEATGNAGVAHYSKLPPNTYSFSVVAGNEDDVWNDKGALLTVVVLPPFWRTWWFLMITSVLGIGLVIGAVHYVSTQKLKRQLVKLREREMLEKERSRIARDLHDQLGANLTQVALLGEMAELDKDLPVEVENHARQISATARETTRSLDEIVWTVNPQNDSLDGLVNYICKYAQDYFALAGLRYRLEVPPDLPALQISPELRHNVFLVAKEAVNNIVKHAQASSATIRLRLDATKFFLEIQDDGIGIRDSDYGKGRNGLKNMRGRMSDVGGTFSVSSATGGGTVIEITAPLPLHAIQ